MLGIKSSTPDKTPITSNNTLLTSPPEKSAIFLDILSSLSPNNIPTDPTLQLSFNQALNAPSYTYLNSPITLQEIENSLHRFKSKALGSDLISYTMLDNLSAYSKVNMCHLFNLSLINSFVLAALRSSIIIPWIKAGKPPSISSNYRPVALTLCLCKFMERIITNRIQWLIETKGLHHPSQAGFRKGRSTTDHIVQLEMDIKRSFAAKKSTVLVFLDINSAYVKV